MRARSLFPATLICLAALGLVGCKRNIVRAAPPSVAPAPVPPAPQPAPAPPPEIVTPPPEAKETIPIETLPAPPVEAEPAPAPARPRPPEPAEAAAKPEAPQIAPQLSPAQLANAQKRTSDNIRVAERNLQTVGNKNLNASQKDLLEKVRGFLGQAHEAIMAADWVRAQSLAEKAQVLSAELIKSL